jgi:hypothetical protein
MSNGFESSVFATNALTRVMSDNLYGELNIEVGPPGWDPHTHTLYLPAIPGEDVDPAILRRLRAFLGHEAGEMKHNTWDPTDPRWHLPGAPDEGRPGLRSMVCALNDARADFLILEEYPGTGLNIRETLREDYAKLLAQNVAQPKEPSVNLVAALCRYLAFRITTYDEVARAFPQLARYLARAEPQLRALAVEGKEEEDVVKLAIELYTLIKRPAPDERRVHARKRLHNPSRSVSADTPIPAYQREPYEALSAPKHDSPAPPPEEKKPVGELEALASEFEAASRRDEEREAPPPELVERPAYEPELHGITPALAAEMRAHLGERLVSAPAELPPLRAPETADEALNDEPDQPRTVDVWEGEEEEYEGHDYDTPFYPSGAPDPEEEAGPDELSGELQRRAPTTTTWRPRCSPR